MAKAAGQLGFEAVLTPTGTWGEPPTQVKQKTAWIRLLAEREGRTVRFGVRLHTISRDSSAEAWATVHRLLDDLDADRIAAAQAGVGLVRGGAGPALVGSHAEVVDRIEACHALGVEHFVLSGYPHLEEPAARGLPERAARGGGSPILSRAGGDPAHHGPTAGRSTAAVRLVEA